MDRKTFNRQIWDIILQKGMNEEIFWDKIISSHIIDLVDISEDSKIGEMDKKYLLEHVILEEDDRITNISEFKPGEKYIKKGAGVLQFPGVRWIVTFDRISGSSDRIMCTITDCVFDRSLRHLANNRPGDCILTLNKSYLTSFSSFVFYDFAKISERYNAFVKIYNDIIQGILDVQPQNIQETAIKFRKRNHGSLSSTHENPSARSVKKKNLYPPRRARVVKNIVVIS